MIMSGRAGLEREGDWLWLDERRRYRLAADTPDDSPELHLDGAPQLLRHLDDAAALGAFEPGMAVVPASFSLQSIIQLRQSTGHPVLLKDGGRIVGVCGEAEIIRALAAGRH
jgi:hypothetical protein